MNKSLRFGGSFAFGIIASVTLGLVSCVVPQTQHDALKLQHRTEMAGRASAEQKLVDARLALAVSQRLIEAGKVHVENREEALLAVEGVLAQTEFDAEVREQKGVESSQLVEQLRAELSRISGHLRAYAGAKDELNTEKELLQARVAELSEEVGELNARQQKVQERVELVKSLVMGLNSELSSKRMTLSTNESQLLLAVSAERTFAPKTAQLSDAGRRLLQSIGKTLSPLQVQIELSHQPRINPRLHLKRLRTCTDVLAAAGVEFSRISYQLPSEPQTKSGASKQKSAKASRLEFRLTPQAAPQKAAQAKLTLPQ